MLEKKIPLLRGQTVRGDKEGQQEQEVKGNRTMLPRGSDHVRARNKLWLLQKRFFLPSAQVTEEKVERRMGEVQSCLSCESKRTSTSSKRIPATENARSSWPGADRDSVSHVDLLPCLADFDWSQPVDSPKVRPI